jgi:hypothetical protein
MQRARPVVAALAVVTALAVPAVLPAGRAVAQPILPTQPAVPVDDPEQAAARVAARAFATAMGDADPAAAAALFAGTPADFSLVESSRATLAAAARLKAATAKAFPAEVAKRPPSDDLTAAGMIARIDRQEVKVTGDEAVVGEGGMKLNKAGGRWRVTALVASPTAATSVPPMMAAMASAMNATAADAEAGTFKTPVEMQVALRTRARAALVAAQAAAQPRPAGTRPATAPAAGVGHAGPATRAAQ